MRILMITAHPDDEAIWCASSLSALAESGVLSVHVICLWTACENPGSISATIDQSKDFLRGEHFYNSIRELKFSESFISVDSYEEKLTESSFRDALNKGLSRINMNLKDFSIIFSHSYYGDERRHPHHIMLYDFVRKISTENDIPHSFSSFVPPNTVSYKPLASCIRRKGQFHLLGEMECVAGSNQKMLEFSNGGSAYMLICQGNLNNKRRALGEYKTIDLKKHDSDYGSFTTSTDFIICDGDSKRKFDELFSSFEIPTDIKQSI